MFAMRAHSGLFGNVNCASPTPAGLAQTCKDVADSVRTEILTSSGTIALVGVMSTGSGLPEVEALAPLRPTRQRRGGRSCLAEPWCEPAECRADHAEPATNGLHVPRSGA